MKYSLLLTTALLLVSCTVFAGEAKPVMPLRQSPQAFIQNKGQWPREVQFLAQTGGMNAWVTTRGIRYDFYVQTKKKADKSEQILSSTRPTSSTIRGNVVDMEFVGGKTPQDAPNELQNTYYNYFVGTDKSKWASNVALFGEVTRREIYKGIDARLYFDGGFMRYDFNVGVSANPDDIAVRFSGAQSTKINSKGELVLKTSVGEVVHQKLFAYQEVNGKQIQIDCAFIPKGKNTFSFRLASYDRSKPLVIDPILYSTFLGGNQSEYGRDIGFDPNGNVVTVGTTMSTVNDRFPIKDGIYPTLNAPTDVYVTKLKADLSEVIFCTYYGSTASGPATGNDEATCLTVDNITGVIAFGGVVDGVAPGSGRDNTYHGMQDGFVAKINTNGSGLICGTNLGGGNEDRVNDLVMVPFTGEFVVVGRTKSTDYPITSGVVRTAMSTIFKSPRTDGFVTKLTATGAAYVFSTYIGIDSAFDECNGVALDKNNSIVVVGSTHCDFFPPSTSIPSTRVERAFLYGRGYRQNNTSTHIDDGFMLKLSTTGATIEHGTLIGGDLADICTGVDVDQYGYAVICGYTQSTDIGANQFDKVLNGFTDGFALKISTTGGGPLFVTYLGGSGDLEYMTNIKYLDQTGAMVVCGYTNSADFPTGNFNEFSYKGGTSDGVLVQLKSDGTVCDYSTFLGGSSSDALSGLAVNSAGDVYVTGSTTSNDFPMTPATTPSLSKQINGLDDAVVLAINTNSVTLQPAKDTTVCALVPLTLSNNASGIGTLRYVWSDEAAGNTTIGTTSEITFTPTVSTTIFLSVKDDNNRPKYAKYKITVKPIPIITTVEEKRTCVGNRMTLTSIAGDPKNIISWYDEPTSTTTVRTGGSLTTPSLVKSTTYYVESKDTSTGCTSGRKPIKITVVPVPSEPTLDNVSQCAGSKATLAANFPSDVNFRWYDAPSGGNLIFVGRTFTTPNVINTTTSYYLETLDTTTNCTSVKRTEAKVIILPSPQPIISGQNAACVNSSGLKYSVPSKANRSYAWTITPNGTITAGNGTNQVTVSWTSIGAGVLSITEKDLTSGCSKDTTYTISISNELSSTILTSGNPALCEGDSIILDAGAGYTSYKWSSGETSQTITVKLPGSFSVDVADAGGCKGKSNIVDVTVSPKPKPIISGQNAVCINAPTIYSVPNVAGNTYKWTVTSEGTIASGDGTSSITVNWLTAGTATIKVTETGGVCSKDTSFTVAVSSSLSPTIIAQSKTSLCEGESVILDAGTFAKYTWSTGETTPTITVKTAGIYTVDVEDAGGCKGKSQPITVTVSALPTPNITANGKLDFCEGDSVILDAGQFAQYNWSTGATTRTITIKTAGAYSVTVTNALGCTGKSLDENITVYPLPVASTIAPQGEDSLIAFGIQPGNTLQWKLNGAAISGATGTIIKAEQEGNYTIETTSPNGCKVTSNVFGYTKPSSAVLTVAISPKTITGAAGETVKVPIVITSSKNLSQATASSFSAELAVEPTLLIPATGTSIIDNLNRRIITINGTRKDGNDTLAIVELKAGLGAMEVSPIILKSLTFTSGKASVTTLDGEFKLTGICTDGGVRLFKSGSTLLTVATEPNPTSDILKITVTAAEVGEHKVYITNALGAKQQDIYTGSISGMQVITGSVQAIPAGVYFLCVQSPTEVVVRRIVIAK